MNIKNQVVKLKPCKRELLQELIVLLVISLFIGFLAPFGMTDVPWFTSVGFWFLICFCGYLIYRPILGAGSKILESFIGNIWISVFVCLLIASAIMAFVVPFVVTIYFNIEVNYYSQYWSVFQKSLVIGGVISGVSTYKSYVNKQRQQLIQAELDKTQQQVQLNKLTASQNDQLMLKLPVDKRGQLYCLEMADHYVKVYTDKGHHMLLMRFKDALELLENHQGLQTHRSWWVATNAVQHVQRDGRKINLHLINDIKVPVSRTYQKQVKDAGLN